MDEGPLPAPSLAEPFAIGEALYDPARMGSGVVSLLALMGVAIVPDAPANARVDGGTGLVLSQSEVRALVDVGQEDLDGAGGIETLPYSMRDLHGAVATLLPGTSVEQLAAAYARAYQRSPDGLIAGMTMGQPIEPDTKLTRTQIWFLLMDGFAGGAAGSARWGTADRELPDLVSPNPQWSAPEWREVFARLPLITARRLVTVNAPAAITQGSTANPAPAAVTMRVNAAAPPLVSRLTGRTLIAARAGSLAGQDVTWKVGEETVFDEVGTIASPLDEPVRVGANGIASFVVQPAVAAAGGPGQMVGDWATLEARFDARALVASAYAVPASLAALSFGQTSARANVLVQFRSPDVFFLFVGNNYEGINFDIPVLGGGTRTGFDAWFGYLSKRKNGNYAGRGEMKTDLQSQVLRGPLGPTCQQTAVAYGQESYVTTRPPQQGEPWFGPTKSIDLFAWLDSQGREIPMTMVVPNARYLVLEFFPASKPSPSTESPCYPFIPADQGVFQARVRFRGQTTFVPVNDAQWTTPGQGYPIVLEARGLTTYYDYNSFDPLPETPEGLAIKKAFRLTGQSLWGVFAARTREEVEAFMDALAKTVPPGP